MSDAASERLDRLRRQFRAHVAAQDAEHPGYAAAWSSFQEHLLLKDGDAVVPPASPDIMIGLFSEEGAVFPQCEAKVNPGARSDCHHNVVAPWRSGEIAAVGTGYGLNDGLWREHSWGWDSGGRVVESTKVRKLYFGLRMERDRAQWFADWIDPPGD